MVTATNHEPSYDWPLRRWVPVESVDVAPDGTQYLLDEQPGSLGALYLVDALTGAKRPIYSTSDYRRVIAYTGRGIFLSDTGINPSPGLWLLNPATGTATLVPGSDHNPAWMLVGADAAWTVTGVPGVSGESVLRLDLASGQVTTWYQTPLPVGLLALDGQDRPLISLLGDTLRIGLLQDQNHFKEIDLPAGVQSAGSAFTAASQTWLPLQRDEGIALFTGSQTVQIFKTQTGPYAFTVAGGCS